MARTVRCGSVWHQPAAAAAATAGNNWRQNRATIQDWEKNRAIHFAIAKLTNKFTQALLYELVGCSTAVDALQQFVIVVWFPGGSISAHPAGVGICLPTVLLCRTTTEIKRI